MREKIYFLIFFFKIFWITFSIIQIIPKSVSFIYFVSNLIVGIYNFIFLIVYIFFYIRRNRNRKNEKKNDRQEKKDKYIIYLRDLDEKFKSNFLFESMNFFIFDLLFYSGMLDPYSYLLIMIFRTSYVVLFLLNYNTIIRINFEKNQIKIKNTSLIRIIFKSEYIWTFKINEIKSLKYNDNKNAIYLQLNNNEIEEIIFDRDYLNFYFINYRILLFDLFHKLNEILFGIKRKGLFMKD